MKKLLIVVLIPLLFIGCKKDSSSTNGNQASITGTWQLISETTYTYTNGSISNTTVENLSNYFLTLNSNNSGSYTYNGKTQNITYNLSGNNISFEIVGASGAQASIGTIKTLNSHSLEIYRDYSNTTGEAFDDVYSR